VNLHWELELRVKNSLLTVIQWNFSF